MKLDKAKKVDKESEKWQEHLSKKAGKGNSSMNTEIQRPKKKESVKPIDAKTAAKIVETSKKAVQKKHTQKTEHGNREQGHAHDHAQHVHEQAAKESKQVKEIAKDEKKEVKQPEKKKKKKVKQKSRKVIVKKTGKIIENREEVLRKKGLPTFRGRFGKRNIRRKSIAKWNKWRVPRGIDVKRVISDGYMPRVGYATARSIRHTHPSGFREVLVSTINQLENVKKENAIRISAGIGSRKKVLMVDRAIEKGLKVLNP